jgi:glycosyltransferase involved in cell wall biosynthesis
MFSAGTSKHLFWIYTESFEKTFDSSTWLEPTRELRDAGWKVTLIGVGVAGKTTVRDVPVYNVPKPPIYLIRQAIFHLRVFRVLWSELKIVDYVMFHQMSAPWVLLFRLLMIFRSRRPMFVMDTRTLPMDAASKRRLKDTVRAGFYRFINKTAHYWVDGQLAITERIAQSIPIPPKNLWGIWPSGVSIKPLAAVRTQRRWPQNDEPVALIYIGTLHYERNIDLFARAVIQANALGMPFTFTMVGDGTARSELEQIAAESNGTVRYVPPIPHEQIPDYLAQAHIGVLPFPDEEKFRVSSPIKLFEYMAAGLPILATRIVCHTDVMGEDASYAFWSEDSTIGCFLDTLRMVHQQRGQLDSLGNAAAAESVHWTWQAAAEKIMRGLETRAYIKPRPEAVSFTFNESPGEVSKPIKE